MKFVWRDRTVRLWDVVTGLPICEPMLPVEQASFFPDGTAILANCSHTDSPASGAFRHGKLAIQPR